MMTQNNLQNGKGIVFIIDDGKLPLQNLVDVLSENGYVVHTSPPDQPLWEEIKAVTPDLILLNNDQICQQLQVDIQSIPLIFLLSEDEPADRAKIFQWGAVDYMIIHPFVEEELLARVGVHIRAQWGNSQELLFEKTLQQCEANLFAVASNTNDLKCAFDLTGKIIVLNEVFKNFFSLAYGVNLRKGQIIWQGLTPEQREFWLEVRERLEKGESTSFAQHVEGKENKSVDIEWSIQPVMDNRGVIIGGSCFGRDITERKQAETALHERERFIQSIADASPVILYVYSFTEDRNIYVNREVRAIIGYTPDEIQEMGSNFISSVIHAEDRRKLDKHFEQLQNSHPGEIVELEYRMRHKDGSWHWLYGHEIVFKRTATGGIEEVVGSAQDITERKRTEEALRKSEQQYRTLFETMAQGVIYQDVQGRIISANPAAEQILGLHLEEMKGRSLLHPEWKAIRENGSEFPIESHPALVALRTGQPVQDVVMGIFHPAEEKYFWIIVNAIPQFKEGVSQPHQVYMTFSDITERRQLEEQLRQSQKMEAVGHLAGGVAHHFNNMLTAIIGYVDFSLDSLSKQHPVVSDLQGIKETAQRAASLTQQLLTFTRKQVIKPKVVNLNDLVIQVKNMLNQLIGENIHLITTLAPDLVSTKIDAGQFEQLLVNLVVNARDAMPEGGNLILKTSLVHLTTDKVSRYSSIPAGHYVVLTVADTGVGMDDEVKTRIFEPFFTTKEIGQGTGLGLSTCFGIVRQHDGYITVDSQPERGTTFRVYLPSSEDQQVSLPQKSQTYPWPKGNETILLVEDEATVRKLTARILRRQGYEVLEATDGAEAIQLVEAELELSLHLLLSDVVMPHMGGDELAAYLRTKYPNLKVLFISGYADDVISQRELQELGISFLSKPFTPVTLMQTVRKVLDAPD